MRKQKGNGIKMPFTIYIRDYQKCFRNVRGKGPEGGIRGGHVGNCFCGDSQLDDSCQHLHSSTNGRTTLAGTEEAVSGDCCEASNPRNLAGGSGGFFCAPPVPVGLTIEEL